MINLDEKMISLGEIVKKYNELYNNKITLTYYSKLGLISPVMIVGKMGIYKEKETIKKLKQIKELQQKGKTLKEIKEIINK